MKIKLILYVIMFLYVLSNNVYADHFDINYSEIFKTHKMIRMIIDAETGFIVKSNQATAEFYGYTKEELIKMKITDINMLTHEQTTRKWESAVQEKRNYFFSRHKLASGDIKDVEVHASLFEHEGREHFYSVIIDITHKMALDKSLDKNRRLTAFLINCIFIIFLLGAAILYSSKEKYKKLANHDYLTGAYSRRYLDELKVKGEITNNIEESNISIIMIDLKDFKCINDTYGHIVGDQVLQNLADILKTCIRENDVVVRYGGDEFLLILYNTNEEHARIVMNRVENKLKTNKEFNFPIEISYGIHETISGTDIFKVIKAADEEMYAMKNLNRD